MSVRNRLVVAGLVSALTGFAFANGISSAADASAAGSGVTVVLDAGHGGIDHGARGPSGLLEKDVVFAVTRELAKNLRERGIHVIETRKEDEFVSLAERTSIANGSRADLYLSIHANSGDPHVAGSETYFLSVDASDEESLRVAMTENQVFDQDRATEDAGDVVGSILGDLIATDHLRASSRVAAAIQRSLAPLPGPSRGVKQAPFVVLMGVNMPAALLELGFLTNPDEETRLRSKRHQRALARAVATAVASELEPAPAAAEKGSP